LKTLIFHTVVFKTHPKTKRCSLASSRFSQKEQTSLKVVHPCTSKTQQASVKQKSLKLKISQSKTLAEV
jgi:hypothetical protein